MEVSVKGEPHEIAALIFAVSERQSRKERIESLADGIREAICGRKTPTYIDGQEVFRSASQRQKS